RRLIGELLRLARAEDLAEGAPGGRTQDVESERLGQAVIWRDQGQVDKGLNLLAAHHALGEFLDRASVGDRLLDIHASVSGLGVGEVGLRTPKMHGCGIGRTPTPPRWRDWPSCRIVLPVQTTTEDPMRL